MEQSHCASTYGILGNYIGRVFKVWTFDNANQGSMNQEPNLNLNNTLIMR